MADVRGLVGRDDLLSWADTPPSKSEFPRLIRRLIQETSPIATRLGFPAGSGVALTGWDGSVDAPLATSFVPHGKSVWELSVDSSPGTKADKDYGKRLGTPTGEPMTDYTYVEAILRPWRDRDDWAAGKNAGGRWREVIAYNVDSIETWLEDAPITHAWISDRLGFGPYGYVAAETWWNAWSSETSPRLTAAVVLAGRETVVEQLRAFLSGPPRIITINCGSTEDAHAFVAAFAESEAQGGYASVRARTAFVDDVSSWRALAGRRSGLILVPVGNGPVAEAATPSGTHHVVVPVIRAAGADLQLPALDASQLSNILVADGFADASSSDNLSQLASQSLVAFRRTVATHPELHEPAWSKDPSRRARAILLAGSWDESRPGDREIVERLSGESFDEFAESLSSLASTSDPLVARIGESWALVSPPDAWRQLGPAINQADLQRLKEVALTVILEPDPFWGMEMTERLSAQMKGTTTSYSRDLRSGVSSSLALLAVNSVVVGLGLTNSGEEWAAYIVREVLSAANSDSTGRGWQGLADLLPVLAEAAPDSFILGVRRGLAGDKPIETLLASSAESGLFRRSAGKSDLLWALERLAWSKDFFGAAIDILAALAMSESADDRDHKPSDSLNQIFCTWHPETSASVRARLTAIDGLRQRHGEVAFKLMLGLLPSGYETHFPTSAPRFRDWKEGDEVQIPWSEIFRVTEALVSRLIEDAGSSYDRWQSLVGVVESLPGADRTHVLDALESRVSSASFAERDKAQLWQSLRALVAKHRDFSDADWALEATHLSEIQRVADLIAPTDEVELLSWLFSDSMPNLGDGSTRAEDFDRYQTELAVRREEALRRIDEAWGFDGVLRLLKNSAGNPRMIGWHLGEATANKYSNELLGAIGASEVILDDLATGWLDNRASAGGWEWTEQLLGSSELTATKRARVLNATRDYPAAWERAGELGEDVETEFWRAFSPYGLGADFAFVGYAAHRLVAVGSVGKAAKLVSLYTHRSQGDSLADVVIMILERLISDPDFAQDLASIDPHDLSALVSYLHERGGDNVDPTKLAQLEWAYLPALGYQPNVSELQKLLVQQPEFYVELLGIAYGHDDADASENSDATKETPADPFRLQTNAYKLLNEFKRLPGQRDDESVDEQSLNDWIDRVRTAAHDSPIESAAEYRIGTVLANAPSDQDGVWPCESVRDAIERVNSDLVDQALETTVINRRGLVSRNLEDGGAQEHGLAQKYAATATRVADGWPRTAGVLRKLANHYEFDARHEDRSAERFRQGRGLS